MIMLPWQIIVGFIALFALHLLLTYLKRENCSDRVEAARREERREATAAYRNGFHLGWQEAKNKELSDGSTD